MTLIASPELVSAVMAEREREAHRSSIARAARAARERCAQAAGGLWARILGRRRAPAC